MSGLLQNIYFVKEGPDNWKLRTLTQIKNGKVHDIRLLIKSSFLAGCENNAN